MTTSNHIFFIIPLLTVTVIGTPYALGETHVGSETEPVKRETSPIECTITATSPLESATIQIIAFLIPFAINGAAPFLIFFFLYRRLVAKKKELFGDGSRQSIIWQDYYCTFESIDNPDLKTEMNINGSWNRNGEPVNPTEADFRRSVMLRMKEDGWSEVKKVKVHVWHSNDPQKIGNLVFDFTFSPDDFGYNDLK